MLVKKLYVSLRGEGSVQELSEWNIQKQKECKESGESTTIWTKECEMKAMNKIAGNLEGVSKRHNSKHLLLAC